LRSENCKYEFQGKKKSYFRGQIFCRVKRSKGRKEERKAGKEGREEVRDK